MAAYPQPPIIPRDEFFTDYWDYAPGEHVTILGPTTWGKTTLIYQALGHTATKRVPAIVLVVKPRDRVVAKLSADLDYPIVREWPPRVWQRGKPGYVFWPRHTFDPDTDDARLHRAFRRVILDSYKKGNRILFADEVMGLVQELDLERELVTVHTRGASMGCGLWVSSQRPRHIPLTSYSQAHHLFLANIPDAADRRRYGEIGGIDPKHVEIATMRLDRFQWLYIRRDGPEMCVIDKQEGHDS